MTRHSLHPVCLLAILEIAMLAPNAEATPMVYSPAASSDVSMPTCPWPEVNSDQLLERRVDALSVTSAKVEVAVAELASKSNLPLSFIQADPEERVSLDLRGSTVRKVLDTIVAQAPIYRYDTVAGRLVLYPKDPKWQTQLENLQIGPAPRVQVAAALANELRQRLSAFSNLAGPWVLGNSSGYTYQDIVTVKGSDSVLNLLVQLLGSRPSTYLLLVKEDNWVGPSLSVSSRDQLRSVKLATPTATLRRRDETIQLRLIGTLTYTGLPKDLTAGACGTVYEVSNEQVLSVSPDGLVKVRASGEAKIKASNEHFSDWVTIRVHLPDETPTAALSDGKRP